MDLSGSAMSIPDENLNLNFPLRRNLGNIEFGLALTMTTPLISSLHLSWTSSEGEVEHRPLHCGGGGLRPCQ